MSTSAAGSPGVLVVGTGEAGVQLAVALRALGYDKTIVLVGEEAHQPYQRPPLSKSFLNGTVDDDDLALRAPDFYRARDIEVFPGKPIARIDVDDNGAGTAYSIDGTTVAFERLVLATGARPRRLDVDGSGLDGVCTLRDLDDAVALRSRLSEAERVVVIGTGFIGLEAAAVASNRGLTTTLLGRGTRLLSRVSAPPLSEFFMTAHRGWGVEFGLGAQVTEIKGDGTRVTEVQLSDGHRIPADVVIVGIGAVPNTSLARALGLTCHKGIVVDSACRTSHPGIVAIGDCTVQPHPHLPGELLAVESVQNAVDQAKIAAATIVSAAVPRAPVPWFWSDQANLKLQIAGISDGHDRYVVRGALDSDNVTILYFRHGALIAGDSVNRPRDFMTVKRALGSDQTIDPDAAADAAIPLRDLLRPRGQ